MSNISVKNTLNNFSYLLFSQILILGLGIVRSLIVPAFLSVESFGYWQIYVFYTAYVGLFALGFNDGIYLRYGSYNYNDLPFEKLRSSTRLLIWMLSTFCLICIILLYFFCEDKSLRFALIFSSFNILILGVSSVLTFIMQITNQIKRFSFFSILDKVLVVLSIILMFFLDKHNYEIIVVVDFISKIAVLLVMILLYKELFFGKIASWLNTIEEFRLNINIGMKLMIANLMGMLITGIGRITVQFFGEIKDYASYSFGTSITNIILMGITAISLLLYPTLKRLPKENYQKYFIQINSSITIFNLVSLLLYFPAYYFIQAYFNKYNDVLEYLNLFFVIVVLLSKMSVLNNTFYKILRKEKEMLKANLSVVIIFCVCLLIFYGVTKSVWSIAFSTVVAMFFRCFSSEIYLKKILNIQIEEKIIIEIGVIIFFILVTTFLDLWYSAFLYALVLSIFIAVNINYIKSLYKSLSK